METVLRWASLNTHIAAYYSSISFYRGLSPEDHVAFLTLPTWQRSSLAQLRIDGVAYDLLYQNMAWDTEFFGFPCVRLHRCITPDHAATEIDYARAIRSWLATLPVGTYVMAEFPSEDITMLQAATRAGMRLVETRLTYWMNAEGLAAFAGPRAPVRIAAADDADQLYRISASTINAYDRFHADSVFLPDQANAMLGKFASESAKGFADIVLVPNQSDGPNNAFLTAKYLHFPIDGKDLFVAKNVLSASAPSNKGWYEKLISEMNYIHKAKSVEFTFMNTQSTNRAVLRVWEKLGFSYGCCTHVLTTKTDA